LSTIDEIKDRVNIVDIISENVKLRRAGSSFSGFCPFHDNKRTPALAVFPDTGTWKCFGCGEGGDVFSYLMKREGWDFKETLEYLAKKVGVVLEPITPQQQEKQEVFANQRQLLEEALLFFQHHLLNTNEGKGALEYLTNRGTTIETIQRWGLGFAPNQWDACVNHFTNQGYSIENLMDVGLITYNEKRGSHYDKFRNRVMFPIRDQRGRMTGFGARTLDPDGVPKYLNSPQTELYNKSQLLYGLDLARRAIREKDQAVIVEGYMDVIIPYQAGFENLVSPMGTALSTYQMQALKRLTHNIILALDPDAAGEKATLRGLEIARETMDHENQLVFDARGLMQYEARLQADIRVCTLPDGLDPDEIILKDPEEWQKIIDSAKPVVIHVMESLAKDQDIDDPKVKGRIAEQVIPLIDDIANPVEREDYRQRLARLLRVDERSLIRSVPAQFARKPQKRRKNKPAAEVIDRSPQPQVKVDLTTELEIHVLRLLLREPEALVTLDRWLQGHHLDRFDEDDFQQVLHQQVAGLLQRSLLQDDLDPDMFIKQDADDNILPIINSWLKNLPEGEPNQRQLHNDLIKSFTRLRMLYTQRHLEQLHFLIQEELEPEEMQDVRRNLMAATILKGNLDKAYRENLIVQ
jgi:DNA primase